jgi:DNA-binding CsgD family transcriptional regulator
MSEDPKERNDSMTKLTVSNRFAAVAAAATVVMGGGAAIAASGSSSSSGDGFLARVAKHLGISTERLEDATKAAAIDQVDADLEAGRITKAQADELKARIRAGDAPLFGGPRAFGFRHHGPPGRHLPAAADYLGLTVPQLLDRLSSGKSLAEIAKAEDKSVNGLKQAMLADAKAHLDRAVSDGMLTQAQADRLYNRLKSHIDELVNVGFRRGSGELREFKFRPGPPDAMWRMPAA